MTEHIRYVGEVARQATLVEDPDELDDSRLNFFLIYWRKKRGDAVLPLRTSFVPQEVRGNLPLVVVADALPEYTDFRYRVVGSETCQYFLADGAGKTVREAFARMNTIFGDTTLWLYQRVCIKRIPLRLTGPATIYEDIFYPNFDMLFLPYSSDGEHADRVVNIVIFNQHSPDESRFPEKYYSVHK